MEFKNELKFKNHNNNSIFTKWVIARRAQSSSQVTKLKKFKIFATIYCT
jgi:hypothetical protein